MLKFYAAVTISMLCLIVAQWSYRFFLSQRCKHGIRLSQILFTLSHGILLLYGWHSTQQISTIMASHPMANKVQMEYLTHALDITTPSGTHYTFYRSTKPVSGATERSGGSRTSVGEGTGSVSRTGKRSIGLPDSNGSSFEDSTIAVSTNSNLSF